MPGGSDQAGHGTDLEEWLVLNGELFKIVAEHHRKEGPPADAKEFDGVPGKLEANFSVDLGQ
jgi:ferredoxin